MVGKRIIQLFEVLLNMYIILVYILIYTHICIYIQYMQIKTYIIIYNIFNEIDEK